MSEKQGVYSQNRAPPKNAYQRGPTNSSSAFAKAPLAKAEEPMKAQKAQYTSAFAKTPLPKEAAIVPKKKCAFAIIHFGKNPVYLELELYFFKILRQYTNNDIIYLYSVTTTPESFVDAVRPSVTSVHPYDDNEIT